MLKRQFISIVSAVLLAAHVSAGCCAHHEHKRDGSACVSFEFQHGHTAHHGDCDHSTPRHDHQPGDHHCGDGHCAFLTASKASLPELASHYAIVLRSADALPATIGQQAIAQDTRTDSGALPPVRPHLVKQVLLI